MISFTVAPSFEDYLSANQLLSRRGLKGAKLFRSLVIIVTVVGCLIFGSELSTGATAVEALLTALAFAAGVVLIWLVFVFALGDRALRSSAKKTYDELGTIGLPTEFILDEHGMQASFSEGTAIHQWNRFRDFLTNDQVLVLRRTEGMFFLIPLTGLDNQTQIDLIELLERSGIRRG